MDREHYYHAYLGTNSMRGSQGIYHLSIQKETLAFRIEASHPAHNADYLCLSPDRRFLYAAYELVYFNGAPQSGVGSYRLEEDGGIHLMDQTHVHGQMACFCSVSRDGTLLYSSSYMAGSVTATPLLPDGRLGRNPLVISQPPRPGAHWPSTHSVYETPDGRFLFSTNVGLDTVFLHDKAGALVYQLPVEGRPRQAAFSPDGGRIYVSTEAGGDVFVLTYRPDTPQPLELQSHISVTPQGWQGHAETAGIKLSPDGRTLVVCVRAPELNCLATFRVDPQSGDLTPTGRVALSGNFPRDLDFTPDGRYLLVGLQFSDTLELFRVDGAGVLTSVSAGFPLPCCSCIKFL